MKRVWIVEENDGYDKYIVKAFFDINKAQDYIDLQEENLVNETYSLIHVDVEDE